MRIVVIAWQHWAAGRRYKSLMRNAVRLGHSVTGFTSKHHSAEELTIAAFKEQAGVVAYREDQFLSKIDSINPDVIFGLWNARAVQLEAMAADWAASHHTLEFFLNHCCFQHIASFGFHPEWTYSHFLVSNQGQWAKAVDRVGWPANRVHIVGNPDLDFITEEIDIEAVRTKLGCAPDQKLIGIFPTNQPTPEFTKAVTDIFALAREYNWKVVLHLHPRERRRQNYHNFTDAFYFGDGRRGYWKQLQDAGALCTVSYCPGNIAGLELLKCESFELMRAADCLISISGDVPFEAYALGKACFLAFHPSPNPLARKDPSLLNLTLTEKIFWALEHGNDIEQDPELIEKYFYKLDGRTWERILNLAERLIK